MGVDAGSAWDVEIESRIGAIGIGGRIRGLRLKRSMGLVELARRTGLSASFLSQLETGRVVPTLRNLSRIALVFERDLSYFFETGNQNCFRISRQNMRSRLTVKTRSGSIISESMSALIQDRSVIPCIAEFPVSELDASFFPDTFEGEEFTYVVDGAIAVITEKKSEMLEPGDVLWVSGNSPREYRCKAGQSAKLIITTCPQPDPGRVIRRAERKSAPSPRSL